MKGPIAGIKAVEGSPAIQLALKQTLVQPKPGRPRANPAQNAYQSFKGPKYQPRQPRQPRPDSAHQQSKTAPRSNDSSVPWRAPPRAFKPKNFPSKAPHSFWRRRAPQLNQTPIPRDRPNEKPGELFNTKMLGYVQVLTVPTADTPGACLLLHFDNRRYLFGHLAEGTQRAMVQRRTSMRKVEDIFLSGTVGWHTAGGLLGMVLTLADVNAGAMQSLHDENERRKASGKTVNELPATALNIYGGQNLTHLLATARRFIFRKGMPLVPHEIREDARSTNGAKSEPDWQDGNIRVWNVPVKMAPAPTPRSTRKRSLSEMLEMEEPAEKGGPVIPTPEEHKLDQDLRRTIVEQMFNSTWSLDTLDETDLHSVNLPAAIFVRDEQGHLKKYDGPMPGGDTEVPNIRVLVRRPWPGAEFPSLPRASRSKTSMCYIIKNQPRRGKFRADVAEKFGITGPDRKKLVAGESVTGKDGTVVTPEMAVEPAVKGHGFVVVDIGDERYVDSFLSRPEWSNKEIMDGIDVFYWILNKESDTGKEHSNTFTERLVQFMREHSSVKHIVLGGSVSPDQLALEGPATVAVKMNRIDSDRFPLLHYNNEGGEMVADGSPKSTIPYEAGRTGATFQISPLVIFQDDKVVPFMSLSKPLKNIPRKVLALADAAKKRVAEPEFIKQVEQEAANIPDRDTEIIPLGTGSSMPSKYRNVSATLIRVPGRGNYLLDCGENTLGQLRRLYGFAGADEVLRDLRLVWISHLHADHHLGLASILKRAKLAQSNAGIARPHVAVASHSNMHDWLREWADTEPIGLNWIQRLEFGNQPANRQRVMTVPLDDARSTGLARIEACLVDHCKGAMAVSLTWPSGLKIAYSGDCRPSDEFVNMARGATLLVHECTFDDELWGDAVAKKHSTMSEALDVGRRMGARRILLTHFSQRYPKIPVINNDAVEGGIKTANKDGSITASNDKAGRASEMQTDKQPAKPARSETPPTLFAWDHMCVKLGEFKMAEAFLPAIRELFRDATKLDQDQERDVSPGRKRRDSSPVKPEV